MRDELDEAQQPHCGCCGTVMHQVADGYRCHGCGHELEVRWRDRPTAADDLPSIGGG